MRSEWSYVSASREDEDMPLMRGILVHWSATHIIREGTEWENRASIVSPNSCVKIAFLPTEDNNTNDCECGPSQGCEYASKPDLTSSWTMCKSHLLKTSILLSEEQASQCAT